MFINTISLKNISFKLLPRRSLKDLGDLFPSVNKHFFSKEILKDVTSA